MQPVEPHREKSPWATTSASGVRVYVHCNPITHFDAWGLKDEKVTKDEAQQAIDKAIAAQDRAAEMHKVAEESRLVAETRAREAQEAKEEYGENSVKYRRASSAATRSAGMAAVDANNAFLASERAVQLTASARKIFLEYHKNHRFTANWTLDGVRRLRYGMEPQRTELVFPVSVGPPTGKLIQGYTTHGLHQAIGRNGGRGVDPKAMLDAVKNPTRTVEQARGAVKYVGERATVILNRAKEVITTWGKPRG